MLVAKQNNLIYSYAFLNNSIFYSKIKVYFKKSLFCLAERRFFMDFTKLLRLLPSDQRQQIQKVIDTLKMGARSDKTILNYIHAINRFLKYFQDTDISKFTETEIIEYIKHNYLFKSCSANTYNMNICAIQYFYSINFNKEFNKKLLPHAKLVKKLPKTIDKELFIKILNEEKNLKHKCWLLLGYCSGLRAEEVATVKIKDINSKEHKLKVLGKRKKERFTILPDITIKYLRLYIIVYCYQRYNLKTTRTGYLFEGNQNSDHISCKTITNYFTQIKENYNLDNELTFHSLRHSFATNFIKAAGDPFVLKSMLGHSSLNTTSIYIHMGRDFNNLKGVNYERI